MQKKRKTKKKKKRSPSALPSHCLALAKTKSPSNRGKMKRTLSWETIGCLREREKENMTQKGREEGEVRG